jgi:hypothetical protein
MAAPRIPRDWTAPLRHAGYEPTELHVHAHECDAVTTCPPPQPAPAAPPPPATSQSRWHDAGAHPAEWAMLAIAGGLVLWAALAAVAQGGAS